MIVEMVYRQGTEEHDDGTANNTEQDIRVTMLDTFMACPHRQVGDLIPIHRQLAEMDPLFYAKLGVWAQGNTDVRDHKELFIAMMLTFSPEFPEVREAGYVLLQSMPPFQVRNILDHVRGRASKTRQSGLVFEPRLAQNMNRTIRSAVERYLRDREANRDWFDSAALSDRNALLSLYCRAHVKPGSDHANAVLFPKSGLEPDAGSKWAQFKLLSATSDPAAQARIIVENSIPYRTAVGAIKQVTPAVIKALVTIMSPAEVVNNLASIKQHGGMNEAEIKRLVEAKLREAGQSSSVSALKANEASKRAVGLSEEERAALREVSDARVSSIRVTRKTGMLVDKSGSMEEAIELAKQIGAAIGSVCKSDFVSLAFDQAVVPITCQSGKLSDWEVAMRGVRAVGWTSLGAGVRYLRERKIEVEQIVVISDFDENRPPFFMDEYALYARDLGVKPNVVMVRARGKFNRNAHAGFKGNLERLGIEHDFWDPGEKFDYYSLPNFLRFLTRRSKMDVVQEIYATELPRR